MDALSHPRAGDFDPTLPLSRAKTIPNDWYTSPAIADIEREQVFARSWQFVGRADQVALPGDFLTAEISGEPLIVVRGEDGVLRGFFNVCRHRAAAILTEPCGHATKLRCRYHGWTYDLAGRLKGVPEFDGVEEFPREENGLPPIHVEVLGPFVFVHLEKPSVGLKEFIPPFAEWLAGRDLASLRFARRVEYRVPCNWKVYVDNYLDGGYHVNTVHPSLAGVLDYSEYRVTLHENCNVQTSPLVPGDPADAATQTRTGTEAAYWWLFPNFMVNHYDHVMDTNWVLPLGPDACKVVFDYYFDATRTPEFIEQSIAVAHQVQLEDESVCLDVQRGLNSRSYRTGRFSVRREAGGYHFHRLLAARFGPTVPG